ncbi:MAG: hypothetical protein JNK09_10935 [Prolixibacteraceae bacterium]|nr:hypothetical protein [Prolixibacteraceae bacterium]
MPAFFVLALLFTTDFTFTSCQKTNEVQTFDDVFETANIQKLNGLIENSSVLSDLPEEFAKYDLKIDESILNYDVNNLALTLEKKIALSGAEVDLLLQNDINTYNDVVERINSVAFPEGLENAFAELPNTELNKYLLVQKEELGDYYVDDYYNSVVELQNYTRNFVIQPLLNSHKLINNTMALKSANGGNDKAQTNLVTVILNNIQKLLEAILKKIKEEKEKKHKGSKGDNGNHNGHS